VISIHDILAPRGQRRYRLGIRYTTDLNNAEWNLIADDFLKPTATGWPRQPPVAPGAGSLNIKGSGACGPATTNAKLTLPELSLIGPWAAHAPSRGQGLNFQTAFRTQNYEY